ncbi:nitrogenase molybdenum-iron protein NifN [Formivibrio citricus]|uniref:Nitrogenase molybdenum-iron protein NifN n=1 Tax=Formivibrio citricus TaxID=83765 RepID=A0A1I4Z0N5_9NEIS|nr:nitrogenase iron-molybdenum cofactor biosynthesis protein NifN [Formivibrio citricus]SFN43613.1 nitrogenase molybdenum-iron protein NifN [Formivibrio citricus]
MAIIKKSSKPLSVNPLKTNACSGATLAFLGVDRSIPLLHSAQGCSAFAKVFFVRHFREPIPLQNTAMDHVATVMNADENLIEALLLLSSKQKPDLIGVATSGLAETQGADVARIIKTFRTRHPEFSATRIVWASTPDFRGGFEQGFAEAVYCLIDQLLPVGADAIRETQPFADSIRSHESRRINLLCPAWMTPGDQEALAEIVEAFGLSPVLLPNLADSLDGHLGVERLNPVSQGGIPVTDIKQLGSARASLVFGRSLRSAGDLLATRTGVPSIQFDQCLGLEATDQILMTLAELSGQPVPAKFTRQRQQLQDAFLDSHFMLTGAKVALAAEPDHLGQLAGMLNEVGAIPVSAVSASNPGWLEELPLPNVTVGDLEDWEDEALAGDAELLITNSHGLQASRRLGIPLLRAGFPQYDWLGGYQRVWLGYRGARQALFDLGNLWTEHHEHTAGPKPYVSRFRDDPQTESCCKGTHHEHATCLCQQ